MRKICVITGTRAEYGLLRNLLGNLRDQPVELQIIATGSHLVAAHGNTIDELFRDGFLPDEEVDMLLASDSPRAIGQSLGLGVVGTTTALSRLAPDIVVVLGDRFEALAAAQAAMILRIPIAHIHGGEVTEGAIDEAIRHSITKMSHLHFVAAEAYRNRVLQLGENPKHIFNVGAIGLDNVHNLNELDLASLETFLEMKLSDPIFLVTFHPVTLDDEGTNAIENVCAALSEFPAASIVFTGSNADAQGQMLTDKIKSFCAQPSINATLVPSLGYQRYLSLMKISSAVIGNSSSGLLEAPSIGVPTVNIGSRQQGRLRAASVIDCDENTSAIRDAIALALSSEHSDIAARKESPYGTHGGSKSISEILIEVDLDGILMKKFNDR